MIRVALNYSPRLTQRQIERLAGLAQRTNNLRALMQRQIAPRVNRMLMRHWESKGAAYGNPWPPWAASTLAARERKGNAALGLLRDSDHLFRTLFREREFDNRLQLVPKGLRLQLNIGVPYTIFHQVGTSRMPERQVIPYPFPRQFTREIRAVTLQFLETGRA